MQNVSQNDTFSISKFNTVKKEAMGGATKNVLLLKP